MKKPFFEISPVDSIVIVSCTEYCSVVRLCIFYAREEIFTFMPFLARKISSGTKSSFGTQ